MTNKPNNQSAQEVDKTLCPTCGASLFESTPLQTKGREVENKCFACGIEVKEKNMLCNECKLNYKNA